MQAAKRVLELKATARSEPARCAYCHDESGSFQTCPGCGTSLHVLCLFLLQRCPTLGCVHERKSRRRIRVRPAPAGLEQPPAWWHWPRLLEIGLGLGLALALGVVGAVSVHGGVVGEMTDARQTKVRADLESLQKAAMLFRVNTGRWPTCAEELLRPPHDVGERWRGPYLEPGDLLSPWDHPYRLYPGDPPVVMCLGSDGLAGGTEAAADTVRLVSGGQGGQY